MTEELAVVMIYCIYMTDALNIDIPERIRNSGVWVSLPVRASWFLLKT